MSEPFVDLQSGDVPAALKRPNIVLLSNQRWEYLKRRYKITPRELQIAKLVCRGLSNEQIADRLDIKVGTVKVHMRNIYRKAWVDNKVLMLLRFIEDTDAFFKQNKVASGDG